MPFQQYQLPRVAELSPLQQQAYTNLQANQGAWQPTMQTAAYGLQGLAGAGTASGLQTAQNQLMRQDLINQNLNAGQSQFDRAWQLDAPGAAAGYFQQAQAADPAAAAQPYLQSAAARDTMTTAQPYLQAASTNIQGATGNTAAQLRAEQAAALGQTALGAAQPMLGRSAQAAEQSLAERALAAAQPYMQAAGRSAAEGVTGYMNPYTDAVTGQIARLGTRNLTENLLPGVSDAFIRAGQFGSKRMGEFGGRALRDTQEAILREQSQALQQGYGQALQASQADLARQAQLAGTAGGIAGADLSRMLQGAGQFGTLGQAAGQFAGQQQAAALNAAQAAAQQQAADYQRSLAAGQAQGQLAQTAGGLQAQQANLLANLGQTAGQLAGQRMTGMTNLGQAAGQLTSQQAQNLANIAQARTQAGQAQQQFGLSAAQAAQAAQAADYQRQAGALGQLANLAQQEQGLRTADVAALETAGLGQQAQQQRQLDMAYQQFLEQQMYPRQQMDWLSTQVRGMAPITPQTTTQQGYTTQFGPSPLSQLASGLFAYKGLSGLS
jgi:hypothetical protein